MGESNPLHNNVYGPPQQGFGMPPPNYSQGPGGPYPPPAGYGQPGFTQPGPGFAPGPYPQMPYPQMPYPQGPYDQGPYQHGPGQPAFHGDPMGEFSYENPVDSNVACLFILPSVYLPPYSLWFEI